MARRADFKARASLFGVDDLNLPWKRALKRAERRAGRSFGKIERAGRRAARGVRRGFRGAGAALKGTGKAAGVARRGFGKVARAGGILGAGLALAVDKAGKFELAVARIGNLLDEGIDPVAEYGDMLQKMAIRFGTDPVDTATAAYMAFSGGVEKSKEALAEFLPAALKSAKAGFAEPAAAVLAMTKALNVFKSEGLSAVDVANRLFVTEALGVTDFESIADQMGKVTSFGYEVGASFEELMGTMASISKVEKDTAVAFTQVGAVLMGIVKPSEQAKVAIKQFLGEGMFGADAIRKVGGLTNWLGKLKEAVDKHGKGVVTQVFGKQRAIRGAFRLVGTGFADMVEITKKAGESAGLLDRNWANVEKRMGFRVQQMKVGFSTLIDKVGVGVAEGFGIAEASSEDMTEGFIRAGKQVKRGAKGFAESFAKALSSGQALADVDWPGMAASAGKALGTMAKLAGRAANWLAKTVDKIDKAADAWGDYWDAAKGGEEVEDPIDKAAKKVGAKRFRVRTHEELRGERMGFGSILPEIDVVAQREGAEAGQLMGMIEAGGAVKASKARRRLGMRLAEKKGGFARAVATREAGRPRQTGGIHLPPMPTGAVTSWIKRGPQREGVQVGGEVKITITDKTASKGVAVEATSKNPRVPVKANVGKRRAGTG